MHNLMQANKAVEQALTEAGLAMRLRVRLLAVAISCL
jgi:hypothetical protein